MKDAGAGDPMTKPDWEKAWCDDYPQQEEVYQKARTYQEAPEVCAMRSAYETAHRTGYLAAAAQHEADIARAKLEWFERIRARASAALSRLERALEAQAHLEEGASALAEILESWKQRAPEAMTPTSRAWLAAQAKRGQK